MKEYKAPKTMDEPVRIFLAGSIEIGTAPPWQDEFIEKVKNLHCIILNPRRSDWDSSWEQKASNPKFREQVEWELNALNSADLIVLNFIPGTQSPISLLELGLYAAKGNLIVCCPEGFWRKGNVDIVCERYGLDQVKSLDAIVELLQDHVVEESI